MLRFTFTSAHDYDKSYPGPQPELQIVPVTPDKGPSRDREEEEAILRRGILEELKRNPRAYDIPPPKGPEVYH